MQLELGLFTRPVIELGPLGLRPKRGRPVSPEEIRALYRQLGDIKRVALQLKIHERRVRPVVRDLVREMRETQWARRRRSVRVQGGMAVITPEVPAGTRWRCPCCSVVVVVTKERPEPHCPRGTRAPWLIAHNPFSSDERWPVRSPIDPSALP